MVEAIRPQIQGGRPPLPRGTLGVPTQRHQKRSVVEDSARLAGGARQYLSQDRQAVLGSEQVR